MKLNLTLYRNEVVPVYTTDKGNKVVNARELYAYLGIDELFAAWVRRKIKSHKLVEDKHFTIYFEKSKKGRPSKEYIFLLDPAKKIAMGTNNAQGDKVKDYFLECEKVAQAAHRLMLPNIYEHTQREVQVCNAKAVNSHLFQTYTEVQAIPEYHREVSKDLTGKTPSQLKKDAKAAGIPSKYRTSGREVMRHQYPAAACAASACDTLVRSGKTYSEVSGVVKKMKDVFNDLLQLGFMPKELVA